jgi:hypothetical protein
MQCFASDTVTFDFCGYNGVSNQPTGTLHGHCKSAKLLKPAGISFQIVALRTRAQAMAPMRVQLCPCLRSIPARSKKIQLTFIVPTSHCSALLYNPHIMPYDAVSRCSPYSREAPSPLHATSSNDTPPSPHTSHLATADRGNCTPGSAGCTL